MSDELKPCPFCGSQAKLEDHRLIWAVRCVCGYCVLGERAPEPEFDMPDEYWLKFEKSAIEAWNRRAQPAEAEGVGKWGELKKLAEKATPGPWWVDSHGHRVSTEDGMQTVFIAADKMGPATRHPETGNLSHWPNDWDASYIVNASPDKILELIAALSAVTAERDAANSRLHEVAVACATAEQERDQLRAEVEALRKDVERYRFLCDPEDADEDYLAHAVNTLNAWADKSEIDQAIDDAMAAKEA